MYCANCGTAADDHLTYCKCCGNRIANEIVVPNQTADAVAKNLSVALGFIGLGGLGLLVGLIAILVKQGVIIEAVVFITLFYLLAHFGICFTLIRNISRIVGLAGQTADAPRRGLPNFNAAPNLREADTNPRLAADFQPPASVTEHTTRTLDAVLRQGK